MTSFAAIVPSAPAWLWSGRIPAGEVTLLAGPCGVGKSFVTADIAGASLPRRPMPGELDARAPGSVILVSAEDDASSATSWRLRAARADLGKVHDMTMLEDGEPFELPDALPQLRRAIDMIGDVRLIVLDPLAALAAVPISSNVTVRRAIITPLRALARDTGAAIVLIHHVTKSGKVAGSQGLMDGLRQVLTVAKSDEDPRVRMLHVEKSNLAADDLPDVRYCIRGEGRFALAAAAEVSHVVAVDISPAMLATLRDRAARAGLSNVECVQAGFLTYEHTGPPADAVFTRNALHQLPDFWKALTGPGRGDPHPHRQPRLLPGPARLGRGRRPVYGRCHRRHAQPGLRAVAQRGHRPPAGRAPGPAARVKRGAVQVGQPEVQDDQRDV